MSFSDNREFEFSRTLANNSTNLPVIFSQLAQILKQQNVSKEQTLDVKKAAAFLRVSTWMIYEMVRKKKIPFFRIGSRIFFRQADLEMMIKEQVQGNVNRG